MSPFLPISGKEEEWKYTNQPFSLLCLPELSERCNLIIQSDNNFWKYVSQSYVLGLHRRINKSTAARVGWFLALFFLVLQYFIVNIFKYTEKWKASFLEITFSQLQMSLSGLKIPQLLGGPLHSKALLARAEHCSLARSVLAFRSCLSVIMPLASQPLPPEVDCFLYLKFYFTMVEHLIWDLYFYKFVSVQYCIANL